MASDLLKAYKTEGTHGVGKITSIKRNTVPNGGIVVTADLDNYTVVEEVGYDATEGNVTVQQLSVNTNSGFLASTVQNPLNECLEELYCEVAEVVNLEIPQVNITTFRTSSYTNNAGLVTIVKGNVAHFDVTTKKYIVSAVGSEHADYATSALKFKVSKDETDTIGEYNVDVIGLTVTAV